MMGDKFRVCPSGLGRIACILVVAALLITALCGADDATFAPRPATTQHLPNAVHVHERVICGGQPEGSAGFAELRRLGVKTVVSVDGAKPDVDNARQFGLRYVHLPHGYDGILESRLKELAKAVRDLEGPLYIHCHHGKHRSPAAAAAACVAAGLVSREAAVDLLALAGTGQDYRGLHKVVMSAEPIASEVLDALHVEFRETVPVPPLAETMVAIERTHDNLKIIAEAGWRPPTDHPDLDPSHEALLMREHFTELLRLDDVKARSARFNRFVEDSLTASRRLEHRLREVPQGDNKTVRPDEATSLLLRVSNQCVACHKQYRD